MVQLSVVVCMSKTLSVLIVLSGPYLRICQFKSKKIEKCLCVLVQNAMLLADEQVKDLMFIRRVDYSKHHLLASQREALAARIREGSPSPIANVNKLSAFATQLQQQALEDHDVVHRVSWAVSCGVSDHPSLLPGANVLQGSCCFMISTGRYLELYVDDLRGRPQRQTCLEPMDGWMDKDTHTHTYSQLFVKQLHKLLRPLGCA